MEELFIQEKKWIKQLRVKQTCVTMHEIHIHNSENDLKYITSVQGEVSRLFTQLDEDNDVLSVTVEVRLYPFSNHIRKELPYFKHMISDSTVPRRTIFMDMDNKIHARVSHELTLDTELLDNSLNIPGVFLGIKCKDNCFNKCYCHGIPKPYIYGL